MAYNFTNITGSDGNMLTLATNVNNTLVDGWFFVIMTVALFVVMLVAMSKFGLMRSMAASAFLTGLVGILLSIVGLISPDYLIYYLVFMSVIGAALFVWSQQGGN